MLLVAFACMSNWLLLGVRDEGRSIMIDCNSLNIIDFAVDKVINLCKYNKICCILLTN